VSPVQQQVSPVQQPGVQQVGLVQQPGTQQVSPGRQQLSLSVGSPPAIGPA
jgi:hypothetical protein